MATARGRHAPPPEVRRPMQRERLLAAAALEFAQRGYRGTSSDTISRRAQMSKATALAVHPEHAQTVLVEIIGAGPRAAARRDRILQSFAAVLDAENEAAAARGLLGRFASPHDSFAVVGAIVELVSRQVRLGVPEDVLDLAPVIDPVILGLLPEPR